MGADGGDRVCFVLTTAAPPATEIRQHTDGLVDFVLRPTLEDAGFGLVRLDSVSEPGMVSDAVMRHLRNDDLVVADLSFGDSTVMYALGVRHSFGMAAIHVHTPHSDFPFDIDGLDAIEIDLGDLSSVKRAQREFKSRIADVVAEKPSLSPVLATLQLDVMREREAAGPPGDGSSSSAVVNGLKAIEQRLAVLEIHIDESRRATRDGTVRSRRLFIVHGHDGELKLELARMLENLDFEVVILKELADSGRTLLDKLHSEVDAIGYVFVLLTPDDFGASKQEPDVIADRARQNVIYEHGLFSGLLDPSRICTIQRGDVELPSDLDGLVTKRIPDGAGLEAIQFELLQELKRAGYDVDANQLMR